MLAGIDEWRQDLEGVLYHSNICKVSYFTCFNGEFSLFCLISFSGVFSFKEDGGLNKSSSSVSFIFFSFPLLPLPSPSLFILPFHSRPCFSLYFLPFPQIRLGAMSSLASPGEARPPSDFCHIVAFENCSVSKCTSSEAATSET